MPPKRTRVWVTRQDGTGFWSTATDYAKKANKFLKKHKPASRALRAFGQDTAANLVDQAGYGRRKRRRRTQRGGASGVVRF